MTSPTTPRVWKNITEIKKANKAAGYHFFDRAMWRAMCSTNVSPVIGGDLFVTREDEDEGHGKFFYTIRQVNDDGRISTVGDYLAYQTKADAIAAARALAKERA